MHRRPPRSTRTDTLFPYTTLFRSPGCASLTRATWLHGVGFRHHGHDDVRCACRGPRAAHPADPATVLAVAHRQTTHRTVIVDQQQAIGRRIMEDEAHLPARPAIEAVVDDRNLNPARLDRKSTHLNSS